MLTRLLSAAAVAGLAAGLLMTILQQLTIEPLIRAAEVLEASTATPPSPQSSDAHSHPPAWKPETPVARLGSTTTANITISIGFALILGSLMTIRGHGGWRRGLAWGIAGFIVVFAAPSMVMPPELPGAEGPPLDVRTRLWVVIVSTTAAGLATLAFASRTWLRVLGLVVALAPQVIGWRLAAPGGIVPIHDARAFVVSAGIVNALAWCALGALTGHMLGRGRR